MKAWREFPCSLWKVTSASSNRMRYHSHDAQIWCKGKTVMGCKGLSSLTVNALCCTQNAASVHSSGLSAEPFMSGFSLEVWMHVKITQPSILPWDGWPGLAAACESRQAGMIKCLCFISHTDLKAHGRTSIHSKKHVVLSAARAGIEEGHLYFIPNKAELDFNCDRPAALVCSFMSNGSWQAWMSPGK